MDYHEPMRRAVVFPRLALLAAALAVASGPAWPQDSMLPDTDQYAGRKSQLFEPRSPLRDPKPNRWVHLPPDEYNPPKVDLSPLVIGPDRAWDATGKVERAPGIPGMRLP